MHDSTHKTQPKYAPTPTEDALDEMMSEALDKQRWSSHQSRWKRAFCSVQVRSIGAIVIVVALLCVGVLGYFRNRVVDSKNEQFPQLRSFSEHTVSDDQYVVGQMYLYFRKSNRYSSRRSLHRLAIPVAQYSNRRFPMRGPFISLEPWLPIFADRRSKQTIIYSKRNGIYVLPALINKYRKRFSIAELMIAGYVSLSRHGARPRDPIDMSRLFRPNTLHNFGVSAINPFAGGFTSNIYTDYGSFSIPKYRENEFDINRLIKFDEEDDDDDDDDEYGRRGKYPSDKRPYQPPRYPSHRYETHTTKRRPKTPTVTKRMKTTTTTRHIGSTHSGKKRDGAVAFMQASNTRNQLTDSTPKVVNYNSVDGYKRYNTNQDGYFTYKMKGIYLSIYTAQVGSPKGNGEGELHLWTRKAGKDRSNSNSVQTIEQGSTSILPYAAIFQAPVGQDITPIFSTYASNKCAQLGLIATDNDNEPLVPSIVTSEIQLSNSEEFLYSDLITFVTQLGSSTPRPVKFEGFNSNSGPTSDSVATDGIIQFPHAGLFFALINFQVGSVKDTRPTGSFHLWSRMNGEDVPGSNLIQTVYSGSNSVIISQGINKVNAGDKVQMVFTTTDENIGIIAVQPSQEPASISASFILFELGCREKPVPHAQLISVKSQWGCIRPKTVILESEDLSFKITNRNGEFTFLESGIYLFIAYGQVGSDDGYGIGDVHLWYQLNGDDVPNSNSIQTVNGNTTSLISQIVLTIRAYDKVNLKFTADTRKGKVGFVASQPKNEPSVASMFITVFQSSSKDWKLDSNSREY